MDSVTQAALGAAIGEVCLSRYLGNKGVLWGALLGTLPDLDILAYPLLDSLARLSWHRGISHSLLFMVVMTPVLAWCIRKVHRGNVPAGLTAWFVFLTLSTHVLIDCFNVYGTQIFEPFSSHRVRLDWMFIIDPLFTTPMLLGALAALFLKRGSRIRRWVAWVGLLLSTAWVGVAVVAHGTMVRRFEQALDREGLVAERLIVSPTPLSLFFWSGLAQTGPDTFHRGYMPWLVAGAPVEFERVDRHGERLGALRDSPALRELDWFSEGFWTVELESSAPGSAVFVTDLRLGETGFGRPGASSTNVFRFEILDGGTAVRMNRAPVEHVGETLRYVWDRAFGVD